MSDDELRLEEADALVGDDIAYWMSNPFLDGEMRTAKVLFWLNQLSS